MRSMNVLNTKYMHNLFHFLVWFPKYLSSSFMASLLFYVPSLRSIEDLTALVWTLVWFYLVPFLFMVRLLV